jgi:hypothetical protein
MFGPKDIRSVEVCIPHYDQIANAFDNVQGIRFAPACRMAILGALFNLNLAKIRLHQSPFTPS